MSLAAGVDGWVQRMEEKSAITAAPYIVDWIYEIERARRRGRPSRPVPGGQRLRGVDPRMLAELLRGRTHREHGPRAGDRVGNYGLVAPLGHGGQASVFLARDLRRRGAPPVAWKTIGPAGGLAARLRLVNEAEVLDGLAIRCRDSAGGISRCLEFNTETPLPFLALRLAPGSSLWRRLRLPQWRHVATAIGVTAAIARVLQNVHDAGVVHRDVTPANLQIAADGSPVVLDFGLATAPWGIGAAMPLLPPGQVLGTRPYVAPECLDGAVGDHRVDVFALGIVLRQWLSLTAPRRQGRRWRRLRDVVAWTTEREPRRRCPSASLFAAALLEN